MVLFFGLKVFYINVVVGLMIYAGAEPGIFIWVWIVVSNIVKVIMVYSIVIWDGFTLLAV